MDILKIINLFHCMYLRFRCHCALLEGNCQTLKIYLKILLNVKFRQILSTHKKLLHQSHAAHTLLFFYSPENFNNEGLFLNKLLL